MSTLPSDEMVRKALISAGNIEELICSLLNNDKAPLIGPYATVSLLDEKRQRITKCIAPGFDEEFFGFLENVEIGPEGTTAAVSIYRNSPVYVPHVCHTTQVWADLPSTWFGIWAAWSVPLYQNGNQVYGALTYYFTVPQDPKSPHLHSFNALAAILNSAIDAYTL